MVENLMVSDREANGTKVSLRDYMDARFESIEKATKLAAENINAKHETMNEFRMQTKDFQALALTKDEFAAYRDKIDLINA